MQGYLHKYTNHLTAFEYGTTQAPNVIVWVAGLGDGLGLLAYLAPLSDALPTDWSVIQPLIKSLHQGWAQLSLKQDIKDLKRLVHFLRQQNRIKVVLAGHLTGSQDVLSYLVEADSEEPIEGGILQGGVLDVEAMASYASITNDQLQDLVTEVELDYKRLEKLILPEKFTKVAFGTPISSSRFFDIAKQRGNEDFFSSYLGPEDFKKTFGKVKKPLLVLYGGKDEFVAETVDKEALVKAFGTATPLQYWSEYSTVVPGASHKVELEEAQQVLVDTVVKFVSGI